MKKLLLLIAITSFFGACGLQPDSRDSRFRAAKLLGLEGTKSDVVYVVRMDSSFRAGDTVLLSDEKYVLLEKIK